VVEEVVVKIIIPVVLVDTMEEELVVEEQVS
jgi:hypothetical protein